MIKKLYNNQDIEQLIISQTSLLKSVFLGKEIEENKQDLHSFYHKTHLCFNVELLKVKICLE